MKKIRLAPVFVSCLIVAVIYSPSVALTITDADWIPISGGPYGVQCMAMDSSGNIYVGGQFRSIGGNTIIGYKNDTLPSGQPVRIPIMDSVIVLNNIAKWDGTSWSSLDTGLTVGNLPNLTPSVYALAVHGTDLYVGGFFFKAGNVDVRHIAKWDGTQWSTVGPGFNDNVQALAFAGNDLYAGGRFTKIWGAADSAKGIARWNGTAWSALGTGLKNPAVGMGTITPTVSALAVSGTDIYAGGYFSLGPAGLVSIAKWNGAAWSALGSGIAGNGVTVSAITVDGSDVYVGGQYLTAGGLASEKIAKWNGTAWSGFGTGIQGGQGNVKAIAVQGTNVFVTGSWFTTAGGVAVNSIAHWDGSAWKTMGQGLSNYGYALTVNKARNVLYVGGSFSTAGGKSSPGLAGVQIAPMDAPDVQILQITCTPGTTDAKISWQKGNGKARVVFIAQAGIGTYAPRDSTTYTPSTVFGKGDSIGKSGWYCIFNGDTGSGITVSGLTPATMYQILAFEYNNGPGSERYLSMASSSNRISFVTIPGAVNLIALDTVRTDSAQFTWHGIESTIYDFEMANDTALSVNLIRDSAVTDTFKLIKGLVNGSYYWRVRASTASGWGVWSARQFTVVKLSTGVRAERYAIRSFSFDIRGGTVHYQLPSASRVSLKVFDMQGRMAATLVDANKMQRAGNYSIRLQRGMLTAGYYLVDFRAGNFHQAKMAFLTR
jgi:hypothetical protein